MNTLNRYQLASILKYLDDAAATLPPSDLPRGMESTAAWSIRMAKELIYEVALSDVAVEPVAEAVE